MKLLACRWCLRVMPVLMAASILAPTTCSNTLSDTISFLADAKIFLAPGTFFPLSRSATSFCCQNLKGTYLFFLFASKHQILSTQAVKVMHAISVLKGEIKW
jgi:hypothetical protein